MSQRPVRPPAQEPARPPAPLWAPARVGIALRLYAGLMRLLLPWVLLRFWWRGRIEPLYRVALGERIGFYADRAGPPVSGRLWLHAVSLGETRAAAALIDALRAQQPGIRLLLTHGTATGREAGHALLREGDAQVWLPWDMPGAVQRFLTWHRPAGGVLMETEVWPALQLAAHRQGVPMALANARLSPKSLRQALRLAPLMRPAVRRLSQVLAQTEADAQRLQAAGAEAVQVFGNLKFDMSPHPALLARGRDWRRLLARPVVMAASTREGEEVALLAQWRASLQKNGLPENPPLKDGSPRSRRPLLLIVPRHPQRFDEVAAMCTTAGLSLARRSDWRDSEGSNDARPAAAALDVDIWLGDSIGELPLYYGCADLALLGGSFEPLGGQNLIEAAACACPLLMGPSTFNFADAAALAVASGAARRVADLPAAVAAALTLLADDDERQRQSQRALAFAAAHRGAAARMAASILRAMPPATQ